jgi:uncharacterized membrane protein YjfL (UPF0719 family)
MLAPIQDYIIDVLPYSLAYFAATLLLLFIAKFARDLTTVGLDDDKEITEKDNVAFGLYTAGYYLGVGLALIGVLMSDSPSLGHGLLAMLQYGGTAIVLMGVSYTLSAKIYLPKMNVMKELVEKNIAVALFLVGRFVFAGLNIFAAVYGEGFWFTSFVYFLLGELGCFIAFHIYCWITPYNDVKGIQEGKAAVGMVTAGFNIAVGILALNALWGDFMGYQVMLLDFAFWFFGGLALLLVFRSVGSRLMFPKSNLTKEIYTDNNIGAGAIMMATYWVMAGVIVVVF